MIKTIVFDFAGVIAPGIIMSWLKRNLTRDDPRYKKFHEASNKWDLGQVTIEEFYALLSDITDIPTGSIQKELYENSTYHIEVIDIVKRLKKNYKIILFSNNFAHNVYQLLDRHDIKGLFDEIIISSEHNMKKPDSRFYQMMLSIANAKKNEVIFIDDTQENVDAGTMLGIQSFLYKDHDQLIRDLTSQGIVL